MRYVIIRDDDTCALTPVERLEELYRPFLDRGLPVNLATIPRVNTRAVWRDGSPEGFRVFATGQEPAHLTLSEHPALLAYLAANPGYAPVLHGYEHTYLEFQRPDAADLARRLDHGLEIFAAAGLPRPTTFVAPYDQLSRAALREVTRRLPILSTGWFELGRLPLAWWPAYLGKRLRRTPHWHVGPTRLLTHPGCLLSHQRDFGAMLGTIQAAIAHSPLTVLVTHWWEYFHQGKRNAAYIDVLHQTAALLAGEPDLKVIRFDDLLHPDPALAAALRDSGLA
jgi:hypothetical protein